MINVIGCVLTVTGGKFNALSFALIGIFYGVMAGFTYSLAPIFGRIAGNGGSPFAVTSYNFIFATIFLALFRPWNTVSNPLEPHVLLIGVGFAIIPTALSYLIYFIAVQGISEISKVPVIASVETVVATLIGIVIFHEAFGVANVIGMLFVMASIAVMNLKFPNFRKVAKEKD